MSIAIHLATLLHWVILLIEKFEKKNMLQLMLCYYILNKNSIAFIEDLTGFFRPPPPKEMDNIFIIFLCTFSKGIY